jgi:hypothetical protein
MHKALVLGIALLVTSVVVLGGTVLRPQVAAVASSISNVFVTNDSSHPVPVREQNTDANGNIKVHEQGTANVNVTNSNLSVTAPPVSTGSEVGFQVFASSTPSTFSPPITASALVITMTPGVEDLQLILSSQGCCSPAANFEGPAVGGKSDIELALTQPVKFDTIFCQGPSTDKCTISTVGAQS